MSKRLRSYVAAIMAMLFAFAIVAVPQKAWAIENGTVYNENGISVSIIERVSAWVPKTINVDVVIDGETVVDDHKVTDVPTTFTQLRVNAPGYHVDWETTNGLTVAAGRDGYYNLGMGAPGSYDLTVKLTKTSADIPLDDYGVFSWSKPNATNFDYERAVKVSVNGVATGNAYTIKTPDELHNTDAGNQFWFTANTATYNSAVEIDPPLSLTGNDITINLTTRCRCGLSTCVCPGGPDCKCPANCNCDDCTGAALGDHILDTGYGLISYNPQDTNGYKLHVELYVNGQKEWSTENPIYVENNRDNTLKFIPRDGYSFFGDESVNSYDIITLLGTGTWRSSTGLITFGGDSESVRQYDNVLKIYAYTFADFLSLNVRPRLAVDSLVSGYTISYETKDPADGQIKTYSYDATALGDLGQTQIIPRNTDVVLTAHCDEGYEVKKWSTLDVADGISLTGKDGSDTGTWLGSVAYGNAATLKVSNTGYTLVTVTIEEIGKANAPSVDEAIDALGGNVTVDCINENIDHEGDPMTVALVDESIMIGEVNNSRVTVTVSPDSYVNAFNTAVVSGHTIVDGQTLEFTLVHDGDKWSAETGTKVVINVDCGAEPEPEAPSVPTENELSDLLEGKVVVTCTNAEAIAHGSKEYGLIEGSYTKDEAVKDGIDGYTYNIVISAEKYVEQFGVDKGLVHLLAEGENPEIPVSFVYDSAANEWKLADVSSTINIDVTCVSAPDFDDIDAAYPDGLVEVECTNVKSGHKPKTYGAMDGGTFLNGTLSYGNDTYNYTFEVSPWAYVLKYSSDCDKVFHYGQLKSKTVEMTYDFSKNVWTVVDSTPIKFEVECDLTSGEDVPTLTEDNIKALLCDSVTIDCINDDADHDPMSKTYGVADVEGGYKLLGIGSNGTNYTATIEIYAGQFINKFESESGVLHGLAEDENDTKTVMLVHDEIEWIADDAKVAFEVVCNDKPVQTAGTITVTPVDMTIYEGGNDGYDGVVSESETGSTTLPEPLFEVTLPEGVSAEDVTFANGENCWTLKSAAVASGTRAADNLYRFVAEDNSEPVRVAYTDDGEAVTDDEFSVDVVEDTFNTLDISIVSDGGTPLATTDDGTAYAIATGTGDLTVRAVNDGNDAVSDIVDAAPTTILDGEAVAVVPEGQDTVYTLNDTGATLPDGEKPSLLFDSIIDDDDHPRTEALNDEIEKRDDIDEGFKSEIKYLDLVDANNGNAWITSSAGIDIYWDYPDKTNQNTKFKVLHFEGLHRDDSGSDDSGFEMGDIEDATITEVKDVELTDAGIKFHVEPGNFSPYALVWDYEDNGGTTPGGDGGTTTKYYEIEASAGEGGSINPSGTVKVAAGTDKTFTITADEGYSIGSVIVDGVNYRQVSSYTFEDVVEDHTISVTFMRGNDPANPDDTGVSDWLETDDHIVFLHGYGDGSGTFGPENQMTRAEVAQMFYNLLLDKSRGDKPVSFTDVPADAYYAEPVFTLASLGIVNGTSPETFEPNRPITRAEFVAIAMRFTNGEFEGENLFVDVPEDAWYRDYVVGAVGYGWIYGYQDGSQKFGPLDTITRGQATMVTNRMLWRACDTVWAMEHMDQLKTFVDLGQSHYAFFDVVEATNAHDYTRVGDTRYENWTGLVK